MPEAGGREEAAAEEDGTEAEEAPGSGAHAARTKHSASAAAGFALSLTIAAAALLVGLVIFGALARRDPLARPGPSAPA